MSDTMHEVVDLDVPLAILPDLNMPSDVPAPGGPPVGVAAATKPTSVCPAGYRWEDYANPKTGKLEWHCIPEKKGAAPGPAQGFASMSDVAPDYGSQTVIGGAVNARREVLPTLQARPGDLPGANATMIQTAGRRVGTAPGLLKRWSNAMQKLWGY